MIRLRVDGKNVEIAEGSTVLDAAREAGAQVPTLCHLPGYPAHTSCMVCLVKDLADGRMLPSCSTPAQDGMEIETLGSEVVESRRGALELLLSEHLGDCEGPCRIGCPARMDIPLMIRQIAEGDFGAAIHTVKRHIALPAVLGRICPAPCEKVCRRRDVDEAVSICLLKRFVADWSLAQPALPCSGTSEDSGRRVAIVGAGPAGLAAAYYLRLQGHHCELFEERESPGGMLRYGVDETRLPRAVLDAEIGAILNMGVVLHKGIRIDSSGQLERLTAEFDAIILAVGDGAAELAGMLGLKATGQGIEVGEAPFATSMDLVFAAGSAVKPSRLAVRAVADGRAVAEAASQALAGSEGTGSRSRFNSRMGRLDEEEVRRFAEGAAPGSRVPPRNEDGGYSVDMAKREAARCLHCDCRARNDCILREYAEQFGARQSRGSGAARQPFARLAQPGGVIFEPGKCIRCGRCVRIGERAREPLGLTFIGRGFDIRVGVPFDAPLEQALRSTAAQCVDACPTGALAWNKESYAEWNSVGGHVN